MVEERRDGSDAASGVTAVTWRGEATEVEAAEVWGGPAGRNGEAEAIQGWPL